MRVSEMQKKVPLLDVANCVIRHTSYVLVCLQ